MLLSGAGRASVRVWVYVRGIAVAVGQAYLLSCSLETLLRKQVLGC